MLGQTKLLSQLKDLGFDVLHITSKFGAYVNQTKVNRTTFFNTLKEWGCQTARKFVIFHYSILSEGINVSGLSHTLLLRNLNIVEMSQTIGRVIRLHKEDAQSINQGLIPVSYTHLTLPTTPYV